jgi:hypothetical protein
MQHAKRMILVDEKFLDHLYKKEDSSWKRSSDHKAKSLLNRELKSDLDQPTVPGDIKAKQHQQHLNRFLHTSKQLPAQNLIDLNTVDDLLDLEPNKKKAKKEIKKASFPVRQSKRKSKKPIKWESWE